MNSSALLVMLDQHHHRGINEEVYTAQPGVTEVDGTVIEGRSVVTAEVIKCDTATVATD
jgi:hypothetical protein